MRIPPIAAIPVINWNVAGFPSAQSVRMCNEPRTTVKFNHISLPGEIRDIIARLALGHGKIFLRPVGEAKHYPFQIFHWNRRSASKTPRSSIRSHMKKIIEILFASLVRHTLRYLDLEPTFTRPMDSTVGLLTASRQTYEESYSYYWAGNTFYLPRGPVSHSKLYWRSIQPQHKALVTPIAIQFSIADLTPEVLDHIEQYARKNPHRGRRDGSPPEEFHSGWEYYVNAALTFIWARKLQWVQRWENLERVRLEAPGKPPIELRGEELQVALRGSGRLIDKIPNPALGPGDSTLPDVRAWLFLRQAAAEARRSSHATIATKGWRLFKEDIAQAMKDESRDC